jgi:acyl-homoserine lactone synthase
MQQILVTDQNADDERELIEEAYEFRHRFFVDHLKWEDLRKPDGRDIDQFDIPGCVHVIGLDRYEIFSYSRLLPTTRPHLLNTVYPQLLDGAEEPVGHDIWEWTRCAVDPRRREGRSGTDAATATMTLAVTEACLHLGINALHVQTHPLLLTRLLELGWKCQPLALPSIIENAPVVPFLARVDATTLETSRALLGIRHPVLMVRRGIAKPGVPVGDMPLP